MWARIRDTPVELPSTDRPPRVLQPLRDFVPWRYRSPTVNANPTDSINHALVVIPTNSDKTTLSRTQRSSGNEYWSGGPGVAGSSPVSPDDFGDSEYAIVVPAEADIARQRISLDSPLGAAISGHCAGDEVSVDSPGGIRRVAIIHVR